MRIAVFGLMGLLAVGASPAMAQAPNPLNVFGVIEKIDATSVVVKKDEGGATATFAIAPELTVIQNKAATLADIRPNDFVASAAVRKEDGKLHSSGDCPAWDGL